MKKRIVFGLQALFLLPIIIIAQGCSKSGGGGGGGTPDPCAGISITVTAVTTNPVTGSPNGSINASATGGNSFTFSINGSAFQSSGNFSNLVTGSYTIVAKNGSGCTGSASFTLVASNPCPGSTVTVATVVTGNRPCETSNGSITATGSGGTGPYTYSINGGVFQSANVFQGLSASVHSVTAKDVNGCTGSVNATVNNLAAGPLFLAVRSLVDNNCVTCHNSAVSEGGMNWTVDCNVINFRDRIRERAVNGNPSPMPQAGLLPASERQKITNWINAGGRFTD